MTRSKAVVTISSLPSFVLTFLAGTERKISFAFCPFPSVLPIKMLKVSLKSLKETDASWSSFPSKVRSGSKSSLVTAFLSCRFQLPVGSSSHLKPMEPVGTCNFPPPSDMMSFQSAFSSLAYSVISDARRKRPIWYLSPSLSRITRKGRLVYCFAYSVKYGVSLST